VTALRRLPWRARYVWAAWLASEARRLAVAATHRHATVRIARPTRLGPGFALWIPETGSFRAGPGCDFRRGFVAEVHGDGVLEIGAGSVFTSGALLQVSTSVRIGTRCSFGQSLLLVDGGHRFRDPDRNPLDQGYDFRPIEIGDGVMVLSKVTILASIGERAVIGANSVVTRPIPAFCLAVGAPARVLEYFGPPDRRPPEGEIQP